MRFLVGQKTVFERNLQCGVRTILSLFTKKEKFETLRKHPTGNT